MDDTQALQKALDELKHITGIKMSIEADSPKELEHALTQIRHLSAAYKEEYNKNYFLQGVLLGSILPGDMLDRAKKLHIEADSPRSLFLIETKDLMSDFTLEILKNLFPAQTKSFVITMDEHHVVVLRSLKVGEDPKHMDQVAHVIADTLNTEAMTHVRVAFCGLVAALTDTPEAYAEAGLAMKVGRLFYSEQTILPHDKLGVGRLIYQLPLPLCEHFLHEIFGEQLPEHFDEETTATVNRFFQNNLNIAETSRQLHVHRNTLIYRLEQLQKRTGLDIRIFEDALTFKIAAMVISYIHSERKI